jgi:hypothetical protein
MNILDIAKSYARTIVPYVVGLIVVLAARHGLHVGVQGIAILTVVVGAVYFMIARLLERYVSPKFGWLLGLAQAPTYNAPQLPALAQVGPVGVALISEIVRDGARLGRHVEHDIRSLAFRVDAAVPIKSVQWRRHGGPFNQGNVGSCTGNAVAGVLNTDPFRKPGRKLLTEKDALAIYTLATQLDTIPGAYPAQDTGSTGRAAMAAAKQMGLIDGYNWALGLQEALAALMSGPAAFGTVWLTGMDAPDYRGIVSATGSVRGGHEYEALGVDVVQKLVWFENSWSRAFGLIGRFAMSFSDVDRLLRQKGDVVQPSLPAAA